MNLQIDIKPALGLTTSQVNIYINGTCYQFLAGAPTVNAMVKNGIVKQVQKTMRGPGNKIYFEPYENGVDGTGVKYTSPEFELTYKELTNNDPERVK